MRWELVFLAVIVAGCVSYKPPTSHGAVNEKGYLVNYEEMWDRAIEYFANRGIPLKNVAKDSGLIATDYGMAAGEGILDCGEPGTTQFFGDIDVNINVILRDQGSDSTYVRVNVFGTAELLSHDGINPNRVLARETVRCESTGLFESEVLAAL